MNLGAGDGKIAIAAAKTYGARSVGIEYNKDMADLAARNAQRAGVDDKVKIIHGDIFVEDFSKATVLTLYLLPDLNLKLRANHSEDDTRHPCGGQLIPYGRLGARPGDRLRLPSGIFLGSSR